MITDISVSEQLIHFFLFSFTGLTCGGLSDIFKVFRLIASGKTQELITDILTAVSIFLFTLFSFYHINGIRLQFYHIAGYFLGGIIYFFALSHIMYPIFEKLFKIFKKILNLLLQPARFSCIMVIRVCFFISKPALKLYKKVLKSLISIRNKFIYSVKRFKKI